VRVLAQRRQRLCGERLQLGIAGAVGFPAEQGHRRVMVLAHHRHIGTVEGVALQAFERLQMRLGIGIRAAGCRQPVLLRDGLQLLIGARVIAHHGAGEGLDRGRGGPFLRQLAGLHLGQAGSRSPGHEITVADRRLLRGHRAAAGQCREQGECRSLVHRMHDRCLLGRWADQARGAHVIAPSLLRPRGVTARIGTCENRPLLPERPTCCA